MKVGETLAEILRLSEMNICSYNPSIRSFWQWYLLSEIQSHCHYFTSFSDKYHCCFDLNISVNAFFWLLQVYSLSRWAFSLLETVLNLSSKNFHSEKQYLIIIFWNFHSLLPTGPVTRFGCGGECYSCSMSWAGIIKQSPSFSRFTTGLNSVFSFS